MQRTEYCMVNYYGYTTHIYYYDESGDNLTNLSRRLRLKPALLELEHNGWKIMTVNWSDRNHATYKLCQLCDCGTE